MDDRSRYLSPNTALCLALLAGVIGCDDSSPTSAPGTENIPATTAPGPAQDPQPPAVPAYLLAPPSDPRSALSDALADGLLEEDASPNQRLAAVLEAAGLTDQADDPAFAHLPADERASIRAILTQTGVLVP